MSECMSLRDKYVFREKIPPWEKEEITDPGTPKPNPDPFYYKAEPASSVCFSSKLLFRLSISAFISLNFPI